MPEAALLAALEQLRDRYSQRQKVTNNLLTALKATTSALGKSTRALRDYAEQNPASSTDTIAQAQHTFSTQRIKDEAVDPLTPDLRREVKRLTATTVALKDALTALRGESVDVVKLGHAYRTLQENRLQDTALGDLLPDLEHELDLAQRTLGDTFGLALRHALAEIGIELGGRPPRFEIGRFEIAADFVNRTAALSYGKNLISKRVPLSVEAVIKAYQRENKAVMGRNEDGARWIEQLYTAWETVRRKRIISDSRAPIVDCYYELVLLRQARAFRSMPSKHTFVDYSRAQFAYDFHEFTTRIPPLLVKDLRAFGTGATKSQTDNLERSIWIVDGTGPNDGRYISDVKFDRDE